MCQLTQGPRQAWYYLTVNMKTIPLPASLMGRKATRVTLKKNTAPAPASPDLSDELIVTLSSVTIITPAFLIDKLDSQAGPTKGMYTTYLGGGLVLIGYRQCKRDIPSWNTKV
jgi:hypothetical protein